MTKILLLTLLAGSGCSALDTNFTPPCSTCVVDPSGPEGWKTMAQDIWDYYAVSTDFKGPLIAPLKDTKWHWFVTGDDPAKPDDFLAQGDHVDGDTVVWQDLDGNRVSDIFIMDWSIKYGVLHHELLHAWLALSASGSDGDQGHTRPEWSTILPLAQKEIPYNF